MQETFLNRILNAKRARVAALERDRDRKNLRRDAENFRASAEDFRLTKALLSDARNNIIAEIKRASPSRGEICAGADVAEVAKAYESGGAAAISILTEEDFFNGSIDDLRTLRHASSLPVLRKDFVVSEFQIYESAANGADAILLIVAVLSQAELAAMLAIARDELHMDAIVEVHTEAELEVAHNVGASLIGVNNRDLKTFNISLDVSRRLIASKRRDVLYISESGIDSSYQVAELRSLGYNGFLVGECLMRADGDREYNVRSLVNAQ